MSLSDTIRCWPPLWHLCNNPAVTPPLLAALVKARADVNAQSGCGCIALHHLCANPAVTPNLLTVLLNAGSYVNVREGQDKWTPLQHLCDNESVSQYSLIVMLEAGATTRADGYESCDEILDRQAEVLGPDLAGALQALLQNEQTRPFESSASELNDADDATQLTTIEVPRRVRNRIPAVANQLYEQVRLAELCGRPFETLFQGIEHALSQGVIDNTEAGRLLQINLLANRAKHDAVGTGTASRAQPVLGDSTRPSHQRSHVSISPAESASQVGVSKFSTNIKPFSANSIISESTSGADQPQRCFLSNALFRSTENTFVPARLLQSGDLIRGMDGTVPVEVVSAQLFTGDVSIVDLLTTSASLRVTSSHRVPTRRGQSMQTVPASGLREGDAVFCTGGMMEQLVPVRMSSEDVEVAQIIFRPDVAVKAFCPPAPAILSNGHRVRQCRQNHTRRSSHNSNGFPDTDDEFR